MESNESKVSIDMSIKTCICGCVYMVPNWMVNHTTCPACAQQRINEFVSERNIWIRRISALKSVISKKNKVIEIKDETVSLWKSRAVEK